MKKTQSGRSMVEMLGVLAIIGVLSVGGLAGYSMGMSRYRVNRTISDVQLLLTNVRTLYANQSTYNGLTADSLVTMGILTSEKQNLFGGAIDVKADTDKSRFTVEYKKIPAKSCSSIMSSDWGTANDGLVSIQAGSATARTSFPVSVTDAATDCGTSGDVDMVWIYQ